MKIYNAVVITTLLYASECWTLLATNLTKLVVFQMSCLRCILVVTRHDQLRNDMIRHHCMEQPTVGKRVQWNRLRWFGHVCRMDDSRLPIQLLWAERPASWHCPPNAPRKQWKDQVAADMTTHLSRRLYCDPLMAAVGMTAERGAWRGLLCDITGINWRCDQSSERAHPDSSSVIG